MYIADVHARYTYQIYIPDIHTRPTSITERSMSYYSGNGDRGGGLEVCMPVTARHAQCYFVLVLGTLSLGTLSPWVLSLPGSSPPVCPPVPSNAPPPGRPIWRAVIYAGSPGDDGWCGESILGHTSSLTVICGETPSSSVRLITHINVKYQYQYRDRRTLW